MCHGVALLLAPGAPARGLLRPIEAFAALLAALGHDAGCVRVLAKRSRFCARTYTPTHSHALSSPAPLPFPAPAPRPRSHPGHNNAFEMSSLGPLALAHGDEAVLERHHAHSLWRLLLAPLPLAIAVFLAMGLGLAAPALLIALIPAIGQPRGLCPAGCDRALEYAIITAPEKRDPALIDRLEVVAGRMLRA